MAENFISQFAKHLWQGVPLRLPVCEEFVECKRRNGSPRTIVLTERFEVYNNKKEHISLFSYNEFDALNLLPTPSVSFSSHLRNIFEYQ